MKLAASSFSTFFQAVYGYEPFPWQQRLVNRVAKDDRWPATFDLPTGSGKTALLDVAVFLMALKGPMAAGERRMPRRIVFVVDRRTIVDQAHERALTLSHKLVRADSPIVQSVAARLRALCSTRRPLHVTQLRGGMPQDITWARRPDQPTIVVSTVDQVGSRLLFRGYGASASMRPIHAGLLGNDCLFLLDEVHLSPAFHDTLTAVQRLREGSPGGLQSPWQCVAMSATPSHGQADFSLAEDDLEHVALGCRLRARKPLSCSLVKVSGDEPHKHETYVKALAKAAKQRARPGQTVGVVVNRVALARDVAALLRQEHEDQAHVFVVTGRMRPLDRDERSEAVGVHALSNRAVNPDAKPVIVVATQCIEAGADYDFDALITECAPLDSLRQRFGRLNRMGRHNEAPAVVLVRSDALKNDDPIYGSALRCTWEWLQGGLTDAGIEAMSPNLPGPDAMAALTRGGARAPVLLPTHLDLLAQTRPEPWPDPDVSLWLHGIGTQAQPEVRIVWRADVTTQQLQALRNAQADEEGDNVSPEVAASAQTLRDNLSDALACCPPSSLEAMSVPLYAARAWLEGTVEAPLTDVEGGESEDAAVGEAQVNRLAILWQGGEARVVSADKLRPDAVIVVPSSYGGVHPEDLVWDPTSTAAVVDRGDEARTKQTGRPVLRLHPAVLQGNGVAQDPPVPSGDESLRSDRAVVQAWLEDVSISTGGPAWLEEKVLDCLRGVGRRRKPKILAFVAGVGEERRPYFVVVGKERLQGDNDADLALLSDDDEDASHIGVEVGLTEHLCGVEGVTREFCQHLGLPEEVAFDIALAARWHDIGKADPRFQRLLQGGVPISGAPLLAKSRVVAGDRATRREARTLSGYPKGSRHELASTALLSSSSLLAQAKDPQLVLHLVASHHGWCRPFAPVAPDTSPVELSCAMGDESVTISSAHKLDRIDSGVPIRFWANTRRYGWYGLAWMEAILRLADHFRSSLEADAQRRNAS
jgi:CRISPR-associated endonuclease/helicase Cas3